MLMRSRRQLATISHYSDLDGNRTMTGYVTGPNNQLLSDGTWDYSYDAEGNRIEKTDPSTGDTWWYSYDNANRLDKVEYAQVPPVGPYVVSTMADFVYDVFGNRIESQIDADGEGGDPSVVTQFAYDGQNVWADLDDSGSLTTRRIFGDQTDQLFARVTGEEVAHYLTDRLGSVRGIADNDGSLLYEATYNGFGSITDETNPSNRDDYGYTDAESSRGDSQPSAQQSERANCLGGRPTAWSPDLTAGAGDRDREVGTDERWSNSAPRGCGRRHDGDARWQRSCELALDKRSPGRGGLLGTH